jgi:hypothetical protein
VGWRRWNFSSPEVAFISVQVLSNSLFVDHPTIQCYLTCYWRCHYIDYKYIYGTTSTSRKTIVLLFITMRTTNPIHHQTNSVNYHKVLCLHYYCLNNFKHSFQLSSATYSSLSWCDHHTVYLLHSSLEFYLNHFKHTDFLSWESLQIISLTYPENSLFNINVFNLYWDIIIYKIFTFKDHQYESFCKYISG